MFVMPIHSLEAASSTRAQNSVVLMVDLDIEENYEKFTLNFKFTRNFSPARRSLLMP